jgi:hypothetical protein
VRSDRREGRGLTAADGPQRFTALATAGGIIRVYWRMSRNPEPERRRSLVVGIAGLVDVIGAVAYVGTALLFIISVSIFFSIRFIIPLAKPAKAPPTKTTAKTATVKVALTAPA